MLRSAFCFAFQQTKAVEDFSFAHQLSTRCHVVQNKKLLAILYRFAANISLSTSSEGDRRQPKRANKKLWGCKSRSSTASPLVMRRDATRLRSRSTGCVRQSCRRHSVGAKIKQTKMQSVRSAHKNTNKPNAVVRRRGSFLQSERRFDVNRHSFSYRQTAEICSGREASTCGSGAVKIQTIRRTQTMRRTQAIR